MRILAAFLVGSLYVGTASGELYRWTDASGRVHYTDTPPPSHAKNIETRRDHVPTPGNAPEPFALQQARSKFPVVYYSAPDCQVCAKGRALLNARGVPFREVSVTTPEQLEELKQLVGGATVPALIVGRNIYGGFEPSTYQSMLDAAGYPKEGVLPPGNQHPPPGESGAGDGTSEPETISHPTGPYAPRFR